jgi:uncharacterized protein (TIGR02001 family)
VLPSKNYAATRYSTLDQINASNVKNLKEAWSFSTGTVRGHEGQPLYVAKYKTDDVEDYPEAYVGLTYNIVEFKQWYTNDYAGTDLDGLYSELNVTFELPAGFGLGLHAGYNYGDAFEDTEYVDYSLGVTYTLGHFDLGLKWVDNDLSDTDPLFTEDDVFNTEGRAILSVSTTFPWSSE